MERSEPTTEEIMRWLMGPMSGDFPETAKIVADRIKSQQRTIADKDAKIADLTARAEQAERERDAAIKFIRTSDWCAGCENMKNLHCDFMKECANPHDLYKLRGQPQEGDGL